MPLPICFSFSVPFGFPRTQRLLLLSFEWETQIEKPQTIFLRSASINQ